MKTRIIVTPMAYLTGVSEDLLDKRYDDNDELLKKLRSDDDAGRIRHLCMIRNEIMKDFMYFVDNMDRFSYGFGRGLDGIERTKESAEWLRSHGTEVCLTGKKVNDHQIHINELIAQNINSVRKYFGEDIDFEYIRDLFVIPRYKQIENIKKEARTFCNYSLHGFYPFGRYLHWSPCDNGLIFDNDLHFLDVVYSQHNDRYMTPWNYTDADADIQGCISDYIENAAGNVHMYVDSENVDIYQLVSMLEALDGTVRERIGKIIVIRDKNNHQGWQLISSRIGIKVEHHHAVRIIDGKSSVDPDLMLDAANDFHENNVRSIIIISSDVDFSSLIRKVKASYLVFYQRNKISTRTLDFYRENGVQTVALNEFAAHRSESFKKQVFRQEIIRFFKEQFMLNGMEIANKINTLTSMHLSDTELKNYYKKYIKGSMIGFGENGEFTVSIPN